MTVKSGEGSRKFLFRSVYHFILHHPWQVNEVDTITRQPDDEIRVFRGVLLGLQQCLSISYVKLDVKMTQIRPCLQIRYEQFFVLILQVFR